MATPSPPLKRGDLRNALISYAQSETLQGRIETMSLRAAARDLGVSSGAVYRHFEDKDALLKEVVHLGMEDLKARFLNIRPEDGVARSVAEAVRRFHELSVVYSRFAAKNPTLWRQMFGRIGIMCREEYMKDPENMRYTIMDIATECARDLYRMGALPSDPSISDIRFTWSAIHGAADLAQSGARLDGQDMDQVARQTSERCLLALGCARETIDTYAPATKSLP